MNNYFVKSALQYLTGLTKYDQITAGPVALNTSWVDLHSELDTDQYFKISSLQLSISGGSPTNAVFRIVAAPKGTPLGDTEKIFPYPPEADIESGKLLNLKNELLIPNDHDWKIQIKADTSDSASVTLDFASVITTNVVNHF